MNNSNDWRLSVTVDGHAYGMHADAEFTIERADGVVIGWFEPASARCEYGYTVLVDENGNERTAASIHENAPDYPRTERQQLRTVAAAYAATIS